MDTTSLELSKELWTLGGWNYVSHTWLSSYYDLGYLLRKLPVQTRIKKERDASPEKPEETHYRALYDTADNRHFWVSADTPENAAAKLAIELFKHGILKKEQSG